MSYNSSQGPEMGDVRSSLWEGGGRVNIGKFYRDLQRFTGDLIFSGWCTLCDQITVLCLFTCSLTLLIVFITFLGLFPKSMSLQFNHF